MLAYGILPQTNILKTCLFPKKSRKSTFQKALYWRGNDVPSRAHPGMEIGTMRKLRLKNDGEGFYNVGTRCVDRTFRFDDDDKTHIVDQIRRMADFCGIEVNTYAVMTNHIHLLLHVLPKRELNDDELVDRVAALYGRVKAEKLRVEWAEWRRVGGEAALQRVEEERNALLRRMGDLSRSSSVFPETSHAPTFWLSSSYCVSATRVRAAVTGHVSRCRSLRGAVRTLSAGRRPSASRA